MQAAQETYDVERSKFCTITTRWMEMSALDNAVEFFIKRAFCDHGGYNADRKKRHKRVSSAGKKVLAAIAEGFYQKGYLPASIIRVDIANQRAIFERTWAAMTNALEWDYNVAYGCRLGNLDKWTSPARGKAADRSTSAQHTHSLKHNRVIAMYNELRSAQRSYALLLSWYEDVWYELPAAAPTEQGLFWDSLDDFYKVR